MRAVQRDESAAIGVLDEEECWALLRSEPIARLAVAGPGEAPVVVPVNIVVEGDVIWFLSDAGEKVDRMLSGPVSLQVDRFNLARRTGWSVLVQGSALVSAHDEADVTAVTSWAPGPKAHIVRVEVTAISGRRIEVRDDLHDRRGYL